MIQFHDESESVKIIRNMRIIIDILFKKQLNNRVMLYAACNYL